MLQIIIALSLAVLVGCSEKPMGSPEAAPKRLSSARVLSNPVAGINNFAEPKAEDDPAPTATPPQAKLVFADLNWSTARLQNAVARAILEEGYGYETESVSGGTIPLMQALIAGEINVSMEFFLPSSQAIWQEATASGTVVPVGNSQESPSWESGFLIPQYTAEANPGLRSVEDLKREENRNLFVRPDSDGKAGLITCLSDWECAEVIEKQVYGYGLQDVIHLITPGSFDELNSEILSAFEKREDILFYYWVPEVIPTKLNTQYGGFYRLEEPEYSDECWSHITSANAAQEVTQGCAYPDRQATIAVRSELRETAPEAMAFFGKWTLSDEAIDALLIRLDETGDSYSDVAAWWLRHFDEWKDWVVDGVADKVLAGLR